MAKGLTAFIGSIMICVGIVTTIVGHDNNNMFDFFGGICLCFAGVLGVAYATGNMEE